MPSRVFVDVRPLGDSWGRAGSVDPIDRSQAADTLMS